MKKLISEFCRCPTTTTTTTTTTTSNNNNNNNNINNNNNNIINNNNNNNNNNSNNDNNNNIPMGVASRQSRSEPGRSHPLPHTNKFDGKGSGQDLDVSQDNRKYP